MMDSREIFSHVDHTILKLGTCWDDVEEVCEQAARYGAATACIPPSCVSRIHHQYPNLPITTVVGFPLGYNTTGTKVFEAQQALLGGASELDMMINLGAVKEKAFHRVMTEVASVKNVMGEHILKVIVETSFLSEQDKIELCSILAAAGADYIKTCTGFNNGRAELKDVELFRSHLPEHILIKAAGGIRSREEMEAFLNAGADRLGCSNAFKVLFKAPASAGDAAQA